LGLLYWEKKVSHDGCLRMHASSGTLERLSTWFVMPIWMPRLIPNITVSSWEERPKVSMNKWWNGRTRY
jgi:hypothetical protein